jgi:CubicO group peptidase (beta-lactamase class C family)
MPRHGFCAFPAFVLLFCTEVLYAHCSPAQFPARFTDVTSATRDRVTKGELPSLAMVVAKDGHIVCDQAFGWADVDKQVPATSRTVYAAGSIAKSVTATGAFLLAGRGKLDLDASPTHYGVNLHAWAGPITIRQLLTMTAGVPHGWFYNYGPAMDGKRLLERYAVGAFPPGKHFSYSNFSYGVVGEVVESVARQSYPQFIADEVLQRLEMTDSGFTPPANASTGYRAGKAVPAHNFEPQAAGGFYTSARDLALFGLFQLSSSQTLIPSALVKAMHTPLPGASAASRYSGGWGILRLGGNTTVLLSNGRVLGGSGTLLLLPEQRLVIACLTNTGTDATDEIAFQFADVFSPSLFSAFEAFRKQADATEAPQPLSTQPSLRGKWTGIVRTPDHKKIPVKMDVSDAGQVEIAVRNRKSTVKDARIEDGFLAGETEVALQLPEAGSQARTFELQLDVPADGQITGILRSESKGDLPHFGLPVFLSLRRTSPERR